MYYDLELAARLDPGRDLNLDLSAYPPFEATALGVVVEAASDAQDRTSLAELIVASKDGRTETLNLRAGPGTSDTPAPARLHLADPLTPVSLTVRVPAGAPAIHLRGISLIDERTGAHSSVTVSQDGDFRRIYSGDAKIYERTGAAGRAWLVHGIQPAADDTAALALLDDPALDPRSAVVLPDGLAPRPPGRAAANETIEITAYAPERVALIADVASPAVLVLADAFYPGWQATVDGMPAPILRANLMFRGLALAPGRHEIMFTYKPTIWRLGVVISLAAVMILAAAVSATYIRRRS